MCVVGGGGGGGVARDQLPLSQVRLHRLCGQLSNKSAVLTAISASLTTQTQSYRNYIHLDTSGH